MRRSDDATGSVGASEDVAASVVEVGSALRNCVSRLGVEEVLRSTEVLIASRGEDDSFCALPLARKRW